MTTYGWLTLLSLVVLLAISTPLLGNYMAKVYGNEAAPGDHFFLPIERFVYRVCRIDPESEQRWRTYILSLLVFTLAGMILTYVILRIQEHLPANPDKLPAVSPGLAFNTAVSFGTNTNWTNYTGEATISQLSQMIGLVWHQFISAAVGMALAAAFIRGILRRRRNTLGNFWVDTVRSTTRVLIPLSFVFAIVLMSQGVIQNFHATTAVTTVAAQATHNTKAARSTSTWSLCSRPRKASGGRSPRPEDRSRAGPRTRTSRRRSTSGRSWCSTARRSVPRTPGCCRRSSPSCVRLKRR
jgi:potassium-transporting ATPase potassium-binding subunit